MKQHNAVSSNIIIQNIMCNWHKKINVISKSSGARIAHWLAQSPGVRGSNPSAADIFLLCTHM